MGAKNSRIEKINAELQKDLYEVITRKLKTPRRNARKCDK